MTRRGINIIYHTIGRGGGTERYVADLIRSVDRRGMPCRVIYRRMRWSGSLPEGTEFVRLRDKTPFRKLNNFLFEATASRHCQPGWPTISVSRVHARVDMAIAGGTHIEHLARKGRRAGLFDRQTIRNEHKIFSEAGVVVAHSEETKDEISRHYGANAEVVYPPVDTNSFSLAARTGREELRQEMKVGKRMVLLFPSNDHARKGLDLILESIDPYADKIVLVVAGKGGVRHPNVIDLGFRSEMPRYYAAADATILASQYEPFGMVGPESVLCGTPVIFPTTVRACEVLSDDACLSFGRSVDGLRATLDRALSRFQAGELQVNDPENHIRYPFSVDEHLEALLELLPIRPHSL